MQQLERLLLDLLLTLVQSQFRGLVHLGLDVVLPGQPALLVVLHQLVITRGRRVH